MCWSVGATAVMLAGGTAATLVTARRGDPVAIPLTIGWFTLMEALQLWGYAALDRCGTPSNDVVTYLAALHIAFQPMFINAFVMATVAPVRSALRRVGILALCGLSAAVILLQLYPFAWAGSCAPGAILCGQPLCTRAGDWHLAWDLPYNGLMNWTDLWLRQGWGFPTYQLTVFVLPLVYGAWRMVIYHGLVGPILSGMLTTDPNEMPAIWCLFSIGILVVALVPPVRRILSNPAARAAQSGGAA